MPVEGYSKLCASSAVTYIGLSVESFGFLPRFAEEKASAMHKLPQHIGDEVGSRLTVSGLAVHVLR